MMRLDVKIEQLYTHPRALQLGTPLPRRDRRDSHSRGSLHDQGRKRGRISAQRDRNEKRWELEGSDPPSNIATALLMSFGSYAPARASASMHHSVVSENAPSSPPIPSSTLELSYRSTSELEVSPPFSGVRRILSRVLRNRGSEADICERANGSEETRRTETNQKGTPS